MKGYIADLDGGFGVQFVATDRHKLIDAVVSDGRTVHDPWPNKVSKANIAAFLEGRVDKTMFWVSAPAFDGNGQPIVWGGKQCAYVVQVTLRPCEVIP